MKIAYFDCFSGAGGDMIIAALLDAGADAKQFHGHYAKLGLEGYELRIEKIRKQGFAATKFDVLLDESHVQPHRHLRHVVEILDRAEVPAAVLSRAKAVFTRLAEAEAAVHGTTIEKVHFHEVGAVDAILDVLGGMLLMHSLGIEQVHCSPLTTGSGTVKCAHGVMPVPAPATAKLLEGVTTRAGNESGELLTPTAAAILSTVGVSFGAMPAMRVECVGYGAGTRDTKTLPNVLRVMIGESAGSPAEADADQVMVLETNLDDTTPEAVAHCLQRLLSEGALDAYTVPINMKKSRAASLLTVICEPARVEHLQRIIFAETTTFGLRKHAADRVKLARRHERVDTPYGPIRMKVGRRGEVETASPEYEDCRAVAEQHGASLREVMSQAQQAWMLQQGRPRP